MTFNLQKNETFYNNLIYIYLILVQTSFMKQSISANILLTSSTPNKNMREKMLPISVLFLLFFKIELGKVVKIIYLEVGRIQKHMNEGVPQTNTILLTK